MGVLARPKQVPILAVVIAAVGCGESVNRRASLSPPHKAFAPQPLPFPSQKQLLSNVPSPTPDPADLLINQAEELYQAGLSDYRLGDLEKAKEEFNQVLGLFLESELDVEGDERLREKFNKLLEDIHGLEVAAQERGDVLSQHPYEAPPIESFAGLTFPVDPKVKARVEQELHSVHSDLPLISNDYVDGVITYFQQRGRKNIETVLQRLGLFKPMISNELAKNGLPEDLIYLAAGESAFNPFALSRKGARGIWQFMFGTAELYGLKRDRWVDERQDPVKSTQAAARHLKDLYQTFGDWYLAMAAYDSGPVTIQRAVEKTGYADFWTLRKLHALPQETENYVPIFLATALIAKDPRAYGFDDVKPDPPSTPDQVEVSVPTDLRLVAQLIDVPVEELIKLNPSLLSWTTPANDPGFVLHLPSGTGELYELRIVSFPAGKRIWWRAHKVEEGETVSTLARKFHISAAALAQANQIDRNAPLEIGTRLILPLAPGSQASLIRIHERLPRHLYRYRVRKGDTLDLVADRFNVTTYQLRRWNGLKTSGLVAGRILKVYIPARGGHATRRVGHRRSTHRALTNRNASFHQPSSAGKAPGLTAGAVSPGPCEAR